jgi:hypothetical protein
LPWNGAGDGDRRLDCNKDLNNRPEVKDLLAKHLRAHYRAWPKTKLPARQKAGGGPGLDPEILAELRTDVLGAGVLR